jgi:hypothetical protein
MHHLRRYTINHVPIWNILVSHTHINNFISNNRVPSSPVINTKRRGESARKQHLSRVTEAFWCFRYAVVPEKLINMCPNKNCSRDGKGKQLCDMFPFKNGSKQRDALSPLLFNFSLEYGKRRVQANKDGLKLNGTRQFPVYADNVNLQEPCVLYRTDVPLPSKCCILYIFFNNYKYWVF